jgi:membrane-associated phospholipid phosphatase
MVLLWSCLTVLGLGWAALILVLAADRGAGRVTALLVPTFLLGAALTHLCKWLLAVPRPGASGLLPQLHMIGAAFRAPVSMPSGHALAAAATAALVLLALPRLRRSLLGPLLLLYAALVGWSRVVVGAHWPSDVLVGAGLGALSVALCLAVTALPKPAALLRSAARRIRSPGGQRWVAVAEIAAAAGLLTERTGGYPAGVPTVGVLVALALGSAAWRWRAARAPRAIAPLGEVPAERI